MSRDLFGFTAKAGFDVNRARRDVRVCQPTFTFVGADGRAGKPSSPRPKRTASS